MDNLGLSQPSVQKRQQGRKEWFWALVIALILFLGAGVIFLKGRGILRVAFPPHKIWSSRPELTQGDLAIKIENASHDESIEFELEMDLTDAGFNVVRVEKLKEIQSSTSVTVKYKTDKSAVVQLLLDWLREDDYVIDEISTDLDPDSEYDLILTIGAD